MRQSCRLIPDAEVDLRETDLLGTLPYAVMLKELVEECPPPFTIGLLGGWGTGKSSVVETLLKSIEDDKSSAVRAFKYDAWEYSKDSFYRTFLERMVADLDLRPPAELRNMWEDRQEDESPKFGVRVNALPLVGWLLVVAILAALLFMALPFEVATLAAYFTTATAIVGMAVRWGFADLRINVTRSRMFAPEQFGLLFGKVVDLALKRSCLERVAGAVHGDACAPRLLVVIDNVDRCHSDLVVELLLTVKNFLGQRGVVVLMPVDEAAIKRHYRFSDGHRAESAEFLRKFFNTTITLKRQTSADLYDFAKGLCDKHGLELPPDAVLLACSEFSASPRRVVQFLNTLQNEVEVARLQEDRGGLFPRLRDGQHHVAGEDSASER